jgi:heme exporter protein C
MGISRLAAAAKFSGIAAFVAVVAGLYAAFVYAPTEATMGDVQRIFYFHLATAILCFFAFFVVFVASIVYLITRNHHWDGVAAASAEIGVVFCTLVLTTGPLWAKPAWGVWWTWDPRLTTTLVLWLIYVGYLMLRQVLEEPTKRATVSAVFGIVGFVDVPIVFMSIRWWRTIHPMVVEDGQLQLTPEMVQALVLAIVSFLLLYAYLMFERLRLHWSEQELDRLKSQLAAARELR